MNTNLNLNQTENELILYWVHLPEHTEEHLQGYIGVTKDFDQRMEGHRRKAPNKYFQRAIRKYGWDNLVKEIIVRGPEKDILELEQMFRPKEQIGWNLAIGGGKPPVQSGEVQSKRRKTWIAANPEAEAERSRKSAEAKQTDEFRKSAAERTKAQFAVPGAREAQAERRKAWIAANPEAEAERHRKSAETRRTDEFSRVRGEISKAYFADPENRKAQSEISKAYYANAPRETCEHCGKSYTNIHVWRHGDRCKHNPNRDSSVELRELETKAKMKAKALAQPKKTCVHCGKAISPGNYGRYHGDKCKHNPNKDTQI